MRKDQQKSQDGLAKVTRTELLRKEVKESNEVDWKVPGEGESWEKEEGE